MLVARIPKLSINVESQALGIEGNTYQTFFLSTIMSAIVTATAAKAGVNTLAGVVL